MTTQELLLIQLAEECAEVAKECAEVAKECAKALRFGLEQSERPGYMTNRQLVELELNHVVTVASMLGFEPTHDPIKQTKVERYLQVSERLGILDDKKREGQK